VFGLRLLVQLLVGGSGHLFSLGIGWQMIKVNQTAIFLHLISFCVLLYSGNEILVDAQLYR